MIYLHHQSLANIIGNKERINANDKSIIQNYRHTLLTQFCRNHHLPIPIYDKDNNGKPFCQNIPALAFNHSHSQNHYALIYSLTVANIGVDIENISRNLNFDKLVKRYFHLDEYQYWQDNGYDGALWFKYWTIKEAVLKAHGLGIRLPLNELRAVLIDKDCGYMDNDRIGKFYFRNIVMGDAMITVAYPFYYGKVDIIVV